MIIVAVLIMKNKNLFLHTISSRWSITPLMYPPTFVFKVPSSAYVAMIVANLFLGVTTTVSTSILQFFIDDDVCKLLIM